MAGMTPFTMVTWGTDSESFFIGARVAPAGTFAGWHAVQARIAGDTEATRWYAQQAMLADHVANRERAAGRIARRGNVVGNGWSYSFECITGRPSGW